MHIDIVGAGPAGLYFAILAKKTFPDARIVVTERNRADDTFGFGIVLSDETLGNLRRADEPTYREIAANFAYWDDIYTHFRGTVSRSTGHGFSGIRRLTLLQILQRRAAELGVDVHYGVDDGGIGAHADADLLVAADGINSRIRDELKTSFAPEIDLRSNRFTWLGARMNLPGFTYSFREDTITPRDPATSYPPGIFNLHAYQFTPMAADGGEAADAAPVGECTLVVETTDAAFRAAGLAVDDEAATARFVERLFAEELGGNAVLTNRSHWRQFPTITCRTWHHRVERADGRPLQVVLLGDAAHTAHFSIGSGTKLALEDAIALHAAIADLASEAGPDDLQRALAHYEVGRRDEVGRIQHSANVSLVWFENVRRFWDMEPIQFNYSLLSRSKQITHENLRLRDPALVADVERWWNDAVAHEFGVSLPSGFATPPMFSPLRLRGLTVPNRVVVSPMAQYSAIDGMPNDWHFVHYTTRALGGAGLVFVEMTCPSPEARITPGCTGLWNDAQADAWKRIVDFSHRHSDAKLCMQLGHAGRKGSTQVGWERMDDPLDEVLHGPNWGLLAPSPIAYREGVNARPRVMTPDDMDRITAEFVASARRADAAGFDMLELHMAHGYLLATFISPVTNQRDDAYGGSLANRLRFPLEVWDAVRAAWPADKPMSVRISATDWIAGGTTPADTVEIARTFKAHGCDLIDVSTGQTDPRSKPVYGRMYQATFAEQVRLEADIATMAVGAVTTADQVNTLLVSGRADLVALARPHLADPYFTLHAATDAGYDGIGWPAQYLPGAQQAFTLAKRAREDAMRKPVAAERARHG